MSRARGSSNEGSSAGLGSHFSEKEAHRSPGTRRKPRAPIDWQAARERIARLQSAAQETALLPPERARALLDERARLLARPAAAPAAPGDTIEVLSFTLARERYALETRYVREVRPAGELTPVPGVPDFIAGVAYLRGEVVAVVELGKLFQLPARGLTDVSRLVVLGEAALELAILADTADEVTALRAADVLPAHGAVRGIGQPYLRGVTAGAMVVLDGAALLRDERLFVGIAEEARGGARKDTA